MKVNILKKLMQTGMQFTLHIANSNSFQSRNLEFESSPENNFVYQNCNKKVEIKYISPFTKKLYQQHVKKEFVQQKL